MTINAGVWIDHHKAVIILLTKEGEEVHQILSEADDAPNEHVADDKREHKKMAHLNEFYDQVIVRLCDAAEIVIIGPGEAKGELHKRMASKKLKGHIVRVETVDKMTDREIAAHVRQLFGSGSKRTHSIEA